MGPNDRHLGEKIPWHFGYFQPKPITQLRYENQHRDAIGETNHDTHRYVAHQTAEAQPPHQEKQAAGRTRR